MVGGDASIGGVRDGGEGDEASDALAEEVRAGGKGLNLEQHLPPAGHVVDSRCRRSGSSGFRVGETDGGATAEAPFSHARAID